MGLDGDDRCLRQCAGRFRRERCETGIQIAADPAAGRCDCIFSHRGYRKPTRRRDPGPSAKSYKPRGIAARARFRKTSMNTKRDGANGETVKTVAADGIYISLCSF